MKYNLDKHFLDLDGNEMKNDLTMAKLLAALIARRTSHIDYDKAYDIANTLHRTGEIELDNSDFNKILLEIKAYSDAKVIDNYVATQIERQFKPILG